MKNYIESDYKDKKLITINQINAVFNILNNDYINNTELKELYSTDPIIYNIVHVLRDIMYKNNKTGE